jgi:hypothetical protein
MWLPGLFTRAVIDSIKGEGAKLALGKSISRGARDANNSNTGSQLENEQNRTW